MSTLRAAVLLATAALSLGPVLEAGAQDGKTYDELVQDLVDEDARKRRVAVRRLSELGTPQAWARVVERLADPDSQVADEAQLRLGDLTDPKLWEDLVLGRDGLRSKDALVRRRVAEAMGRTAAVPYELRALFDVLGDREAEVRRLGVWSLERLAASGALDTLGHEGRQEVIEVLGKSARTDKDGGVRGAALVAHQVVCALDGEDAWFGAVPAEKALASRDARERTGAVLAIGRAAGEGAAALLLRHATDESLSVRIALTKALSALGNRAGAEGLVQLLEAGPVPAVERRVVGALQRLSGLAYRRDPRPWRDWVDALGEDWVPADGRDEDLGEDGTVTKLVGLPIRSERLAILVDMSGSMWQTRPDGNRTKDLVDEEVRRCLEALPPTARFNLVPYATAPDPYDDELVEASPKKVAKALEWFEENELRGKGNVWDAIETALADPEVDTIVVMTDGAPSGGPHWNLELMVPLLLERNRLRNVTFDVLLTESSSNLVRHWERLAAETGGTCLQVSFDS